MAEMQIREALWHRAILAETRVSVRYRSGGLVLRQLSGSRTPSRGLAEVVGCRSSQLQLGTQPHEAFAPIGRPVGVTVPHRCTRHTGFEASQCDSPMIVGRLARVWKRCQTALRRVHRRQRKPCRKNGIWPSIDHAHGQSRGCSQQSEGIRQGVRFERLHPGACSRSP